MLFVEGENGKVDVSLYRAVFSEYIVVPRGSCDQVIHSVKSLKANAQFHHLSVYGLIDRDRRVEAEIERLRTDSIYVLDVAEVENLFCTREILKIVSERLSRDAKADFETVSKAVFNRLRSELDTQVTLHTVSEIKFRLNCFDEKVTGPIELDAALNNLIKGIDVQKLYDWVRSRFESAIQNNDYELLLRLYNRKSLSSQASLALGLKADELPNLVVRIASTDGYNSVRTAILKFAREFAVQLQ